MWIHAPEAVDDVLAGLQDPRGLLVEGALGIVLTFNDEMTLHLGAVRVHLRYHGVPCSEVVLIEPGSEANLAGRAGMDA